MTWRGYEFTQQPCYLLDTVYSPETKQIAVSASDFTINLFDINDYRQIDKAPLHKDTINDLVASSAYPHTLFTGSSDKTIAIWDSRSSASEKQTIRTSDVCNSLAVGGTSQNMLVAGTGTFITIWDVRNNTQPIIVFEDSHSEEVTQIRFANTDYGRTNTLCSGGMDGLICVFDITELEEDEAVKSIMLVDHTINKLGFFNENLIHCITSTEQFSVWSAETSSAVREFGDVRSALAERNVETDYLINCIFRDDSLNLCVGNNAGDVFTFNVSERDIEPSLKLSGSHSDVVRSILWVQQENCFVTVGEDGKGFVWREEAGGAQVEQVRQHVHTMSLGGPSRTSTGTKKHRARNDYSPY